MRHFMLDLETRGNTPGCHILSIGLIAFDPLAADIDEVFADDGFYTVVSKESCHEALLHIDQSTMDWWGRQSTSAREVLAHSEGENAVPLHEALIAAVDYTAQHVPPRNALIWGNGADFDNPILTVAARMVRSQLPWVRGIESPNLPWQWGNRCYRTIKNLGEIFGPEWAAPPVTRSGTYHNALDDAKTQALHMWDICTRLAKKVR